jgi:hypothetical protein
LPQTGKIDLGVDECGTEVAMTQNIGNGFERMASLEHSGSEGVPKDMGPPAGDVNARCPDATTNDGG